MVQHAYSWGNSDKSKQIVASNNKQNRINEAKKLLTVK